MTTWRVFNWSAPGWANLAGIDRAPSNSAHVVWFMWRGAFALWLVANGANERDYLSSVWFEVEVEV